MRPKGLGKMDLEVRRPQESNLLGLLDNRGGAFASVEYRPFCEVCAEQRERGGSPKGRTADSNDAVA